MKILNEDGLYNKFHNNFTPNEVYPMYDNIIFKFHLHLEHITMFFVIPYFQSSTDVAVIDNKSTAPALDPIQVNSFTFDF